MGAKTEHTNLQNLHIGKNWIELKAKAKKSVVVNDIGTIIKKPCT